MPAVHINAAGDITWQAGRALRFDAGGRLHQVKACASATDSACATSEDGATRHCYNGQHQRVLKDEPTGQTVYAYGNASLGNVQDGLSADHAVTVAPR